MLWADTDSFRFYLVPFYFWCMFNLNSLEFKFLNLVINFKNKQFNSEVHTYIIIPSTCNLINWLSAFLLWQPQFPFLNKIYLLAKPTQPPNILSWIDKKHYFRVVRNKYYFPEIVPFINSWKYILQYFVRIYSIYGIE